MVKSSLLRRGAEVLAALIIIVSTVVYASVGIKNTGNNTAMLAAANKNDSIQENAGSTLPADSVDTFSQEDDSLNSIYSSSQTQSDNEKSVVSQAISIKDDTQDNIEVAQSNIEIEQPNIEASRSAENVPSTQVQEQKQPVTKYVILDKLNVRSGPGSENEILAELKLGDSIQALQQEGEWMEIIIEDNVKAYVFAEYLSDTKPAVYKYINIDNVNFRKGASSDTQKLGSLTKGERVQFISSANKWSKVISSDNVEGYIYSEYLSDTLPPVYKYISGNELNIRKTASSKSEKLGTIKYGNKVQVFEESGNYIRILTNGGIEGYVLKEYVVNQSLSSRSTTDQASSSNQPYNSDLSSKIIEYAKTFAGVPYVYGGSTPNGFDCSGFTNYVFKHFNINVPRSAASYSGVGTSISRTDMKPGDVLLFDRYNDYTLGHVGIYLGNDTFIHASSSKGKVVIASLSRYSGNILGIRRYAK